MAGIVRTEFDVKAQKALQAFDNLTKKQQKVVVESSKMGKEFSKTERKAKKLGKSGNAAFDSISNRVHASIDVVNLFSRGVQKVIEQLEFAKVLNKEAFNVQGGMTDALGSLISNAGFTNLQTKKVTQFAGRLAGETGIGQVDLVNAVVDAVSGAGASNFSLKQIEGALKESAIAKVVDSQVDAGALTAANLKLQKTGFSEVEASNFAKIFVKQFGGKLDEAVKQFPGLLGTVKAVQQFEENKFGKAVTKREDIFALFGGLTQGPIPDVEQAATATKNLFSKVNISGFDFKTKGTLSRLSEIGESALSGKIADKDIMSAFTKAGAKGGKALSSFAYIGTEQKQLERRRAELLEADKPGNINRRQLRQLELIPQAAIQLKSRREAAASDVQKFRDIKGAESDEVIESVRRARKDQGLDKATFEEFLYNMGISDKGDLKSTALGFGMEFSNIFGFLTKKTEEQIEAQERAAKLYEEAAKKADKTNTSLAEILKSIDLSKISTPPGNGQGDD